MSSIDNKIYKCDICGHKEVSGWYTPDGWQYTTNWGDVCSKHVITITPAPTKKIDWFLIFMTGSAFIIGMVLSLFLLGYLNE